MLFTFVTSETPQAESNAEDKPKLVIRVVRKSDGVCFIKSSFDEDHLEEYEQTLRVFCRADCFGNGAYKIVEGKYRVRAFANGDKIFESPRYLTDAEAIEEFNMLTGGLVSGHVAVIDGTTGEFYAYEECGSIH